MKASDRRGATSTALRATVVVAAVLLSSCVTSTHARGERHPNGSAGRTTAPPVATVRSSFRAYGLTFTHPVAWREQPFVATGTFESLITYLSPLSLADPCTTVVAGGGETTTCHEPVNRLPPGSVLVTWTNYGAPHPSGTPEITAPNTTISGRPARVERQAPGDCSDIGADVTITADIARPTSSHLTMRACLRGPGVDAMAAQVRAMLDSITIA